MLVACVSCKADTPYYVKNYLNDLSTLSGIGNGEEMMDNLRLLREWEIIDEEDLNHLNDKLDYLFLTSTISRFTGLNNQLSELVRLNWISPSARPREKVSYETGLFVIGKAVEYRNNPKIAGITVTEYKDEVKPQSQATEVNDVYFNSEKQKYEKIIENKDGDMVVNDAQIDDVFEEIDISGSFEIDFSEAEVIPYEPDEDSEIYVNHNYDLLSAKSHSFHESGFAISYSLSSSGISVHVSKDVNKINVFADLDIYSVKPTFKWKYEKGDVKNCFFDLSFKTTEKLGASIGRYKNYYLQFKDLDSGSFSSLLKSMIKPHDDYVEASLPICKIRTPIPNLPTAFINLDLLINIYVSGKVELVLYNAHEIGFETVNGNMRIINKHSNNFDGEVGGSAKAATAVNFSLEAATFILADVEVEGGLKAKVKSTLHLYDDDGNKRTEESDVDYSTLQEISKDNTDVKVCGDLSLNWLFDIELNTYKTRLYNYGFNRSLSILDEDNQVFGNLSHIENGMFVKKCTRNSRPMIKEPAIPLASNKIVLNTYAEVINVDESFEIEIMSIPQGYSMNDIKYSSVDNAIARVVGNKIIGVKAGSCQIKVSTGDGKYNSYINILVSTG